jgi:transposase InsO family protein
MPWKEACAMDERQAFVQAWLSGEFGVTELCERFGVSRPTGYKWLYRFKAEGMAGMVDRSCAPLVHPNATPAEQVAAIVTVKRRHLSWGPLTVRDWLRREHPRQSWPAVSTVGEILKRHGLVQGRRRRHRTPPHTQPFAAVRKANDVWSADFKGQFELGNSRMCYPLTISDNHSRYLLCCQGMYNPTTGPTQAWFERTFREYGLPGAIRTDNGVPFASIALGGLSELSVWLLKLGVWPERIEPGQPQQNGRHERMHRTLKAATAHPPKADLRAQQRAFNRFCHEYNQERPHRSLGGGQRPSDLFHASPRPYPSQLPEVIYPDDFAVRKVKPGGYMKWHGQIVYVTKVLEGEHVGLRPLQNERWEMYFAKLPLGVFDARSSKIIKPHQNRV